ncbi:hypothetical protein [Streptococcus uberis]|uniref:hypothetical protein n=1 Tax=Streptococcus uberis TaxID=1349 RepID=UPI0020BEE1DE|nr:hypothetical protein [Streptococcus uberis]MCK1197327.1 hypothetical protein [Streptococcus uberis]MCK1255348.1 hypothetical protein [Streptococcus uberis]MCZ8466892.1 hypothetical protein [Streptococcus uberis]
MSKKYNDFNRQKVARLEYEELAPNQHAYIGKGKKKIEIGTVREVVTDDFGQKAYVIQSEDKKEVSVCKMVYYHKKVVSI